MSRDFVDLHLHSTYSNLDGFGLPEQIITRAKEIGRNTVALTDHGSISGFVKHMKACKSNDIKPVYGCEFYMVDSLTRMFAQKEQKKKHITVLAKNAQGYSNLLKLATLSYSKGYYYKPTVDVEMLFENQDGLIVLSGCWSGLLQESLRNGDLAGAIDLANSFKNVFGDRYFLEIQHFKLFTETSEALLQIHKNTGIPIVLTCDPHYLTANQSQIQEVLHAIRDKRTFDDKKVIEGAYQWQADDLFDTVTKLMPIFDWTTIFENTNHIGDTCNVDMVYGSVPRFIDEQNRPTIDIFKKMLKHGLENRNIIIKDEIKERLQKEIRLITEKDFVDYFVIVADMIQWAKNNGIYVGPARGSAAGSLVCYCLGITEINPLKFDLIFERFIDENRTDLPDIDVDFEGGRRDEVKKYLYNKYGYDRVCNIATFTQFGSLNSVDDVGRIFGVNKDDIKALKKHVGGNGKIVDSPLYKRYNEFKFAEDLDGQLRQMGQHAAGVLIGDRPLDQLIALYTREGENIASVEMGDASELGLVKIDVLSINELSLVREIADVVGMSMQDVYNISIDDKKTLKGFRTVDVEGVFQFNGYATKNVLKKLKDVNFEDLIACVALSKPGPFYSGGTDAFISSANGDKSKDFDWYPALERITRNTNGQIIYQEQVVQVIREVGNMTWEEANKIRGVISKSKGAEAFGQYWESFKSGAMDNGLSEVQAQLVWDNIKTMGGYAFNKSHAVSYALLAWWSMYFKQHHSMEFYCACLNKEEDPNLLREIKKKNIKILPTKLGFSKVGWSIEGDSLRTGLMSIHGIGEKIAHSLVNHSYKTTQDFKTKKASGVTKRVLAILQEVGAVEIVEEPEIAIEGKQLILI